MTRYIVDCDDPDDLVEGVRLIQRLVREGRDTGSVWEGGIFEQKFLWHAYKTKSGFVARQCRDKEPKEEKE